MPAILRLIPYLLVSLCLAVGVAPTHAQENRNYTTYLEQFYDVVDYPMFVNPELVLPAPIIEFPKGIQQTWLAALEHKSERELQRQVCNDMIKAVAMGMKGLEPCIPELQAILADDKVEVALKVAACRALATFKKEATYDSLLTATKDDRVAREFEAELAGLCADKLLPRWRDRLKDLDSKVGLVMLSLEMLGKHGTAETDGPLAEAIITNGWFNTATRLKASSTISALGYATKEIRAAELAKSSRFTDRLLVARLLNKNSGESAADTLESLLSDKNLSVSAAAARSLAKIDSDRLVKRIEELASSKSSDTRHLAVELMSTRANESHVTLLSKMFNDTVPSIRQNARKAVLKFVETKPELKDLALKESQTLIKGENWRGLQQATIVMALLGDSTEVKRIAELVNHKQPQVYVTSAWAVRVLKAKEVMPVLARRAIAVFRDRVRVERQESYRLDDQMCQIFFAIKETNYIETTQLLWEYTQKVERLDYRVRAAAVWAVGYIYANEQGPTDDYGQWRQRFITELEARVNDTAPMPDEDYIVKKMASMALGRMHSKGSVPLLTDWYEGTRESETFKLALRWALIQITGNEYPEIKPPVQIKTGWILQPLKAK